MTRRMHQPEERLETAASRETRQQPAERRETAASREETVASREQRKD